VVLLGWSRERVIFHDPAEGPFRVADTDEWQRRWSASGNWTLLLLPSERPLQPARSVVAQKTPDPAPSETQSLHERASHEFRRENWGQAAEFAAEIVAREPEDADAWRLLGTSRFLEDRPYEALEAWNAVGEPTIDLVRIDGIERLRPRTLEQYLGLANGRLLTARALRRGERRLALLPAAQAGRLAFRPIPGGRASLEGALLERRAFPTMRGILIDIGVRAATEQALGFDQNMLGPNGETIRALAQWQSHRSRVLLAASAPRALGLPGVVSAQLLHDVQTYQGAAELGIFVNERRRRVSLSIDNWWTADLATSVEIASDDWAGRTRTVSVAERTERRLFADHVAVGGRLQGWWSRDRMGQRPRPPRRLARGRHRHWPRCPAPRASVAQGRDRRGCSLRSPTAQRGARRGEVARHAGARSRWGRAVRRRRPGRVD
jgi:hypothetical protein